MKLVKEIIKEIKGAGSEGATVSYVWGRKDSWILEYSNQKFSAIMNALVDKGFLNKTTKNRVNYFRASSKKEPSDWKENSNLADTPLPEPPIMAEVFD